MKKLFLLAAMCCLVKNSWADCQLIGSSIPSGTGVNARSIVNIQYNKDTKVLSFEDTYETSFTAYARSYSVYFYEYSDEYAFYENNDGASYKPVYYGTACNSDAFIPGNTASELKQPAAHFWVEKTFNNCAGGVREIDLSKVIPQIAALGYNHVMVGILPSYRISSTANFVYYSIYGDWHSWLMNVAHFKIKPLIDRMPAGVTEVHTPTKVIDNTSYDSPFPSYRHVWLCEAQDTAKMLVNIFPASNVDKTVSYFWQKRKDNETSWKKVSSGSGSFTKTKWNDAVSTEAALPLVKNFMFESSDMDSVTLYRVCIVYEGDSIFSNAIQLDAKYRVKVYGPVKSKTKATDWRGYKKPWDELVFDTITFEVAKKDTIFFKPYMDMFSECGVNHGFFGFITAPDGTVCQTNWDYSCLVMPTVNTFQLKFFVNGKLYHSIDNVICGFEPKYFGTLEDPTYLGNIFKGKWIDRATGKEYANGQVLYDINTTDNMNFDALMDSIPEGALGQQFNIGKEQPVYFSKGNLQYQASTDTWRFAENQYDYIGDAAGNNTEPEDRATQAAWIDLFGFGTSGYNGLMPYETDYSKFIQTDITGTEYDWGVHNAISNGGNKKGQWRLLSFAEWGELLLRSNAYVVTVADKGYMGVLKPNTFKTPAGVTALADGATLSMTDFDAYNAAGVPFFPMGGVSSYIEKATDWYFMEVGTLGSYFSSTLGTGTDKYLINMSFRFYQDAFSHEINGKSIQILYPVRLVCDYVEPTPPTDIEEVAGDRLQVTGSRKVLRDGQLLILRDGKTYNAQGAVVE